MEEAQRQLEDAWLDLQLAHTVFAGSEISPNSTEQERVDFDTLSEALLSYMRALNRIGTLWTIAIDDTESNDAW